MPMPPFGRLFWKFLLFFFLAQTTAVFGVGLAIWAIKHDHEEPRPPPPWHQHEPPGRPPGEGPPRAEEGLRPPPPPPSGLSRLPVFHLLTGAAVSLVFATLLAAYVARPIRRLQQAMREGAAGRLDSGLSAEMAGRNDELTDLCHDFDRMARHLAQLMAGQRRLLHDVSHELRSPLARLTALIGLIRQQPDRLEDCLSRLERESERMDRLLSELLTLSRLEAGMIDRAEELLDLGELLEDVVSDASPMAAQAGCEIELSAHAGAHVRGNPEMLHRLFDNLLRNALTHAASGEWVACRLEITPEWAHVIVEDRGAGVPEGELGRIFQPFFRGSRAAGRSGHGLGLVIATQIVEAHGGRIDAANRPQGGLQVSVFLPLAEGARASG